MMGHICTVFQHNVLYLLLVVYTHRVRLPTLRHYLRRNRSTRLISGPIGLSFELKFNTMKELTLQLIIPQSQQSAAI